MDSMTKKCPNEPIAIIGSGFRFPGGANSPSKLWDLLREAQDVQSSIPEDRFSSDGFFHPANDNQGTGNTQHGYFLLEDYRKFDAQFFGIKPVEANSMDPQQRLLLEAIYESVEAAGLVMEDLRGSLTAVYVGLMAVDYTDLLNRDTANYPSYVAAGTARSMIANRVSYFFDWRGPSMTIDTACSSSLVAVHQAVQAIRAGDSKVAVAAGANLLLGPEQFIAGSNMGMLSPDGRSYMWDTRANGYARGEGIAAVVLKSLSAAIADGDDIECVIVETGLNQDGKTKGLTVPSAAAQAALIQATYAKASLDLTQATDRPQFFEAHGTGTPAGDPIEAEAIHEAFFKKVECDQPIDKLYVGSIKTVIGHMEGAAGLAGLLKASLALKHGIIPPNRLFENLAPTVRPFYDNLEIVTKARPWPSVPPGSPRRASVNSFGFGGTNAHCILESYTPNRQQSKDDAVYTPFVFSASSEKALTDMVASYSKLLRSDFSISLHALSRTLCSRRSTLPYKAAFSARDTEALAVKLDVFTEGAVDRPITAMPTSVSSPRILGIFTGQGAQWAGMASKLMELPAAKSIIDELEQSLSLLEDPPAWSLKAELSAPKSCSRVLDAAIAQPACTAVQILLVRLLRAAGVTFSAIVGHSSGEIGAAYAAGYLTASDAIRIAYYRGVHLGLVQGSNGEAGGMLAVGASYEEAQNICDSAQFRGKICVAASNSTSSVTLSGDVSAIEAVEIIFRGQNKFARRLRVDNAYHSHHMKGCSEAITKSLRTCNIKARRPTDLDCLWISSVYQQNITNVADSLNDIYWHSNTVGPVLFSQALECALTQSYADLAVEIGAHPALKGPASQVIEGVLGHTMPYTGLLSRNVDDVEAFSSGLGYIWANLSHPVVDFVGYDRLHNAFKPVRVLKGLPTYPWEHQRAFWHESRISKAFRYRRAPNMLIGTRSVNYSEDHISWTHQLIPKELTWLQEHRIQGQMIFPGAGYMSSAFEAAREFASDRPIKLIELTGFVFERPLVFETEDSRVEILLSLTDICHRSSDGVSAKFSYYSADDGHSGSMSLNASGRIHITFGDPDSDTLRADLEARFGMTEVSPEKFYNSLTSSGYDYTGPFRALTTVKRRLGIACGLLKVPGVDRNKPFLIHPATLDAAVHSILVAYCYPGDGRLSSLRLPTEVSRIAINPKQALDMSSAGTLRFVSHSSDDDNQTKGDVDLYPADGSHALVVLEGLRTKPMVPATAATDVHLFSQAVWGPAAPVINHTVEGSDDSKLTGQACVQMSAAFVKQISHRYPSMNILEITAGMVATTRCILMELDEAFASYTCTGTSAEHLKRTREACKSDETRMMYKTLDIEQDIESQGFTKFSFDLVIANLDLDETNKLSKTLSNVRRLLKAGGYLLLLQKAPSRKKRYDSTIGAIVSNELSFMEGEPLQPTLDMSEWDRSLQQNSFAAIDLCARSLPLVGVIAAEAVDSRTSFLHNPLASVTKGRNLRNITLVGGMTTATSSCLQGLTTVLHSRSSDVLCVRSLEHLADADLALGGTVMCLQDHDKFVFEGLDEKTLKGMQKMFAKSRNLLWVTRGYKCGLPYARMMVAFARCLLQETPHVRLQFLDLPSAGAPDAGIIAQYLLRLHVTDEWEQQGRLDDMLWSLEPEISHQDGQDSVPRVKLSTAMNYRYNSGRRKITTLVDPAVTPVALTCNDRKYELIAKSGQKGYQLVADTDSVTVRITHSTTKAVKIERCGYFYPVLAVDLTTKERVIALSSSLASEVSVRRELVQPYRLGSIDAVRYLTTFFYTLIAEAMLRDLGESDSLLVFGPEQNLAAVIQSLATSRGIKAEFIASTDRPDNLIAKRTTRSCRLRRDEDAPSLRHITRIVHWMYNEEPFLAQNDRLGTTDVDTISSYVADGASSLRSSAVPRASKIFGRAAKNLPSLILAQGVAETSTGSTCLADVHTISQLGTAAHIVDWLTSSEVHTIVEPVDCRALFQGDRTYWLAGLTGGLGLSLCQWMILHGAKHIVISSRNPKIDAQWNAHFQSLNANVKIYANDITDRRSVQTTYENIKASMPPIAGVCQGAMVLQDTLVQNLDVSRIHKVLKPKVEGAINLDEIFQNDKLDFFIMLSSIAAVTGNPGQAAYAAANGFLAGLAMQRRARGVAASTVNMGAIVGNGYLTRELTTTQQVILQKAGAMWTSEQDFHQAFAEAVIASPSSSRLTAEFCTGMRTWFSDESNKPRHANSPIFSHLVRHRNVSELSASGNTKMTIKAQLLHVTATEDIHGIISASFAIKLRKALQMSPDGEVISQTADALGIDSLIAVDIRSWFMKELNIDMPVLKIIGGGTMLGVVERAQELLDPELTPGLRTIPTLEEERALSLIDVAIPGTGTSSSSPDCLPALTASRSKTDVAPKYAFNNIRPEDLAEVHTKSPLVKPHNSSIKPYSEDDSSQAALPATVSQPDSTSALSRAYDILQSDLSTDAELYLSEIKAIGTSTAATLTSQSIVQADDHASSSPKVRTSAGRLKRSPVDVQQVRSRSQERSQDASKKTLFVRAFRSRRLRRVFQLI